MHPRITTVPFLGLLCALLLAGCGGGSAGGIPNTVPPPPVPVDVFELEPRFGGAGDVITFRATSIDSDPANLRVTFSDQTLASSLDGLILSVTDGGTQQGLGTIWEVDVMVPGGVRSGSVSLLSNGFSFGGFGFTAAPEIVGVVVGQAGDLGAVSADPSGAVSPDSLDLYGYNLVPDVNLVSVEFSGGDFDAPNLFFNPPPGAGYTLPAGTSMLRVGLPGNLFSASCDVEPLGVRAFAPMTPGPQILQSGLVEVSLADLGQLGGPPGDAETPAFFSGAIVPAGIRRGDITVDYSLFMAPVTSTYSLLVEYQDPADNTGQTWLPCTPAASSPVGDVIPGSRVQEPGNGLIGVGSGNRFVWDSLADLPLGAPVVTRLRLSLADETPPVACSPGMWETPRIVIHNDAPASGALIEDFDDASILDPAGGNAIFIPGFLSAPANGGTQVPRWGTGTVDLVFTSPNTYVIDTTSRSILDTSDTLNPVELLPQADNPGFAFGEFHLRTWIVETGATIFVVGDAPLVIRCAGDGLASTTALSLGSALNLDGSAGSTATPTARGTGGAGGPGGGDGGDGGFIEVFGPNVTLLEPALAGQFGGGAGGSLSLAGTPGSNSLPHAGPGGGGGGAIAGGDGTDTANPTTTPIAPAGRGGAPRGDDALTLPVGGGGGGGGGACAIRIATNPNLTAKHGGGGGGGGGAVELVVRGRAEIGAAITARGGNGGNGNGGSQPGAGGGGAGGTIAIRTTGDLELLNFAQTSVAGGLGGSAQGASPLRGGDGSVGSIRFEFDGSFIIPPVPHPGLDLTGATSGPFATSSLLRSRARTRPYRLTTFDGVTTGSPTTFGVATIFDPPGVIPGTTQVTALFEGAAAHPTDRSNPGEYFGFVSDPGQLEGAEFIRVWWFIDSTPANLGGVDRLEVPYDH